MSERHVRKDEFPHGVRRLREEHKKVVTGCEEQIQHWKKVEADYSSLQERLGTLPDRLSYDIMVPFGPLAFMPGKLVHTNEVTVLLGDNWFAKCSAKQAADLAEHRKSHVRKTLDDLSKVVKNFETRAGFTEDLQKLSGDKGDYVDIREEMKDGEESLTKGKRRLAHKPFSKPKVEDVLELPEEEEEEEQEEMQEQGGGAGGRRGVLSEEELWARLDELEAQEEQLDEEDRTFDTADMNGEDTTSSSSSSEEEKDGEGGRLTNGLHGDEGWPPEDRGDPGPLPPQSNGTGQPRTDGEGEEEEGEDEDGEEEGEEGGVPTIYFCHTKEPKKVRINTGKNTMLKFSERKEEAKRKKKNGSNHGNGHGHSHHELSRIKSPADIYRVFVDVVNGELVPRKSILKSRSRENSVCSDTSESSAADFEERRGFGRALSHDEGAHSDTSEGVSEQDSPTGRAPHLLAHFEAFSGTVVEKDPGLPSSIPHLTISPPALPTIPERKCEDLAPEGPQGPPKRVSKFKASRAKVIM
ncbi:unconventional prefoldin RPB5 interactor 1 [Anguilla anguilla]|uniref:unconventional prefoldin RPB5 interactor 1 n=1 Tax=Anguilla anguilla TaxID=7936 RepID=UPI0015A76BC4|nr:unconventional prefoldin RPB5 interactor 1 [Anguilla anguilla]